jgi:hypothetical protein
MAKTSRYIIWAHRDADSLFGAATNPVIRNGALLHFEDETYAKSECDRLNAHSGNPHVRYSIKHAQSNTRSVDGRSKAQRLSDDRRPRGGNRIAQLVRTVGGE